jgi:hypothetical protein
VKRVGLVQACDELSFESGSERLQRSSSRRWHVTVRHVVDPVGEDAPDQPVGHEGCLLPAARGVELKNENGD